MTNGITSKQAEELLKEHGLNTIEDRHKSSIIKKFVEQISSFLTILLIIAAALSFFIGEVLDGSLILTIVILNAGFGIYQEFKAEQAVVALRQLTVSTIRVFRDGTEQEIDSKYLVPGDVFFIEEGVKLPADARIIEARNLEINEAALTGESMPVVKELEGKLFMGTIVAKGRGKALVTSTGMKTKFGEIAEQLSSVESLQTPLQKKLAHLTRLIGIGGITLSFVVFMLSALQGHGYFPSFLLAISLAVAVVPESLPAVMTVILSIGVKHMATRKAIIRRLSAIEALGSTTLIATDKTGTLTENKMNVREVWVDKKLVTVESIAQTSSKALQALILDGVLCSTASLADEKDQENSQILGDPTEGALLLLARKQGLDISALRTTWELIDEIPFDSVKKRMSVVVKNEQTVVYSKGAPESILAMSTHIQEGDVVHELNDEWKASIETVLQEWSRQGLRVLAFGYRTGDIPASGDPDSNLIFLGMAAIHDPPRKEAAEAIVRARQAGIEVVMITGDNEKTAEAIGRSLGLVHADDIIVTGAQVEQATDAELLAMLPRVRIFARTTPFHKSRIVSLYQQLGEVVTVTGDGVNDAIALKQADVGVAMGKVGTDVARETSDMVITDDNFATIVNAVEEGRNIVLRLKNSIKYLLTGNLSEGLVLLGGLMLGFPPILLPIQLLYINLVSDGVPALALAFTPRDETVMKQHPLKNKSILNAHEYSYIISIGVVVSIVVLVTYYLSAIAPELRQTAAFTVLALVQTVIFMEIWFTHTGKRRTIKELVPAIFLITVSIPLIGQLLMLRIPAVARLFHISVVSYPTIIGYVAISLSVLILIAFIRMIKRKIAA